MSASRGPKVAGRVLSAAVIGALAASGLCASAGAAPTRAHPTQRQAGAFVLELIDQRLAFGPGEDIELEYRLTGDLAALELEPPPTTATDDSTTPSAETSAGTDGATGETTDGEPVPPPLTLTLEITNYRPLEPGAPVDDLIGSGVDADDFQDVIDGLLVTDLRSRAVFEDDGSVTFSLSIPTDLGVSQPDQLKFDEAGLYPLRVRLRVGDVDPSTAAINGTVVQRTGATDGPRSAPPIDVALLAAIEDPGPVADGAAREQATTELAAIASATSTVDTPFTLAIPPSVLLPATANPEDEDALTSAFADDELVAMPATSFDVSSAVDAGVDDAYARELRTGEDELTSALPRVPSSRAVDVATTPLSTGGAGAVRDLGTRMVVMTADAYDETVGSDPPAPIDQFAEIALPDGGTLPLLVVDPVGADLVPTAAATATATPLEWALATTVEMILERDDDRAERSRVLATPDLGAPDPQLLVAFEQLVTTTPSVRMATVASLTGITDVATEAGRAVTVELPPVAGPSIEARSRTINGTKLVIANASSMLQPGDPRPQQWTADVEELIATGYPDDVVEAEVSAIRAETDELLDSIVAPDPFTFTLTGRSGDIDMRIGNVADEPLKVKLRLSSPKLTFPQGDQVVELRPNDETSVIVPVRARANGTSSVTVEILTPVDQPLDDVTLTSRVNALTGLGQVLTGGLILVLITWWFNHWRTRRRATAAERNGDDVAEDSTDEPATTAG